jgi:hypothetical protein
VRLALAVGGTGGAGFVLAGCAGSGASLGREACANVATAEHLMAQARAVGAGTQGRRLQIEAERQLETAEPLAARAAGGDGSWQALQATLQEVGSVPIGVVLPAAKADCHVAL